MTPAVGVRRFEPRLREDFFRVHSDANGHGWCRCVAWWVNTWEGWSERTAEQNLAVREQLLARGEYDGYVLCVDREPVAWCQAGSRDRLRKLVDQLALRPDPSTWGVMCLFVAPAHRGRGLASTLLREALVDMRRRGVDGVEASPNGRRRTWMRCGTDRVRSSRPPAWRW